MTDRTLAAVPAGLADALQAAQRGDLAILHSTIDWELSEAAIPARSAGDGVPGLLVSGLDKGIAGIQRRHRNWLDAADVLRPIAERLATVHLVRPATPDEREPVVRAIQIAALPAEATAAQRAFFDPLRRRAAALGEVWVVETGQGNLPVVVTAHTDMLVLPLDMDVYL